MSDDEKREETEDVEAHRAKHNTANDEGKAEGESDDDFEAHRHKLTTRTRSV
jgi:hypothetical protein